MTKKRIIRELTIEEISGVTRPANAEALVTLMKGEDGLSDVATYLEKRLASLTADPTDEGADDLKLLCKSVMEHLVAKAADTGALYRTSAFQRVYAVMGAADSRRFACRD
ncbi:MAG: hypothetical protein ACK4NP_14610 [Parvularculaceae bacterium]